VVHHHLVEQRVDDPGQVGRLLRDGDPSSRHNATSAHFAMKL
jgi:hypothetical protein